MEEILLDKFYFRIDCLLCGFLALVVNDLLLLKQVAALGINGDDQRAELLDLVAPQGLGHTQLVPVMLLNLQHFGSGDHSAAGGEDTVWVSCNRMGQKSKISNKNGIISFPYVVKKIYFVCTMC